MDERIPPQNCLKVAWQGVKKIKHCGDEEHWSRQNLPDTPP
jgi:cation transport regulator ChaB